MFTLKFSLQYNKRSKALFFHNLYYNSSNLYYSICDAYTRWKPSHSCQSVLSICFPNSLHVRWQTGKVITLGHVDALGIASVLSFWNSTLISAISGLPVPNLQKWLSVTLLLPKIWKNTIHFYSVVFFSLTCELTNLVKSSYEFITIDNGFSIILSYFFC